MSTASAQPAIRHSSAVLTWSQWLGLLLAPLICLAFWFAPTHEPVAAQRALAIAAFMIVLFITEPVDHATAGFLGVLLFWASGIVRPEVAFSGFAGETPWFLFGALLIGAMASESGLAERLAYSVAARTGSTYRQLLLGFIILDFLLTFAVPSGVARVTILATVALGVVDAFKVPRDSNIGRGLMVIVTVCAGVSDKMLIAGATTILARGMIQNLTGIQVLYSRWFLAYLPCDFLTVLACWFVILWLYPPEKKALEDAGHLQRQVDRLGAWKPAEKRCAFYLGLAIVLWMTDFIHHMNPTLVGVGVGLLSLMPGIGILKPEHVRRLHFGALWFTAAVLGMGRVLTDTGGLLSLTGVLTRWMQPLLHIGWARTSVLYWTGFVYHFFLANETAMLSTSLPVVLQMAKTAGLSPLPAGLIWTFSTSGKIFVYQSAVLIVGYSFGCFKMKDMLKVGLALSVIEWLIQVALVALYWPLIGLT